MQLSWKCFTMRQKSCRDTLWYFFIGCRPHALARSPKRTAEAAF